MALWSGCVMSLVRLFWWGAGPKTVKTRLQSSESAGHSARKRINIAVRVDFWYFERYQQNWYFFYVGWSWTLTCALPIQGKKLLQCELHWQLTVTLPSLHLLQWCHHIQPRVGVAHEFYICCVCYIPYKYLSINKICCIVVMHFSVF